MGEPGRDQAVERLPDLELHHAGLVDDLLDVARAVEQRQQPLLLAPTASGADSPMCAWSTEKIRSNDGNLLLDQAPLVHPPRALEQQELRVDPDQEVLALGTDAGLEVEGPRGPGEQVVDRLLDLEPDVALELLRAVRAPSSTRISPSLCSRSLVLRGDRLLELLRR